MFRACSEKSSEVSDSLFLSYTAAASLDTCFTFSFLFWSCAIKVLIITLVINPEIFFRFNNQGSKEILCQVKPLKQAIHPGIGFEALVNIGHSNFYLTTDNS